MDASRPLSAARRAPFFGLGMALLIGGALYLRHRMVASEEDYANFKLVYDSPGQDWKALPHSPQAIFLYRQNGSDLLMRGAASDIEADYNPTPELDRDGLARYMLDVTDSNLKEWRGEMMDTVDAQGTSFRLIRRWCPSKRVISAVAVRGNTSILVTMSGAEEKRDTVEQAIPRFKNFLATLALERRVYQ